MIVECYLKMRGWTDAIKSDVVQRKKDKNVLFAIFSGMMNDFFGSIDSKKIVKQN